MHKMKRACILQAPFHFMPVYFISLVHTAKQLYNKRAALSETDCYVKELIMIKTAIPDCMQAAGLRAASCRVVISPKESLKLAGYFPAKESTGVHDDLFLSMILLEINRQLSVWINLDLCVISDEIHSKIVGRISGGWPVEPKRIVVSATHTHAAPNVKMFDFVGQKGCKEDLYLEEILQAADRGMSFCMDHLERDVPEISRILIDGYYSNRNSLEKPVNKEAVVIRFKNEKDRTVACWLNLSCHSTVLGPDNTLISSDLLGNIAKKLEKVWGIYPMTTNGCCGDASTRLLRKGNDFAELERVSNGISKQIVEKSVFQPLSINRFDVEDAVHEICYDMDPDILREQRKQASEKLETETGFDAIKILKSTIYSIDLKLKQTHVEMKIPCSIIRMGELDVVTIPGELVASLGLKILNSHSGIQRMICTYVNHYVGYIVNKEDYDTCYEGLSSPIPRGNPEKLIDRINSTLKKD